MVKVRASTLSEIFVGIRQRDGTLYPVFSSTEKKKKKLLLGIQPGQEKALVEFFVGEGRSLENPQPLGTLELTDLKQSEDIEILFIPRSDHLIEVNASLKDGQVVESLQLDLADVMGYSPEIRSDRELLQDDSLAEGGLDEFSFGESEADGSLKEGGWEEFQGFGEPEEGQESAQVGEGGGEALGLDHLDFGEGAAEEESDLGAMSFEDNRDLGEDATGERGFGFEQESPSIDEEDQSAGVADFSLDEEEFSLDESPQDRPASGADPVRMDALEGHAADFSAEDFQPEAESEFDVGLEDEASSGPAWEAPAGLEEDFTFEEPQSLKNEASGPVGEGFDAGLDDIAESAFGAKDRALDESSDFRFEAPDTEEAFSLQASAPSAATKEAPSTPAPQPTTRPRPAKAEAEDQEKKTRSRQERKQKEKKPKIRGAQGTTVGGPDHLALILGLVFFIPLALMLLFLVILNMIKPAVSPPLSQIMVNDRLSVCQSLLRPPSSI